MKVWVVVENGRDDGDAVRGVFSTHRNAEDFARTLTELAEREDYYDRVFEVEDFNLDTGITPWWCIRDV